MSEPAYDPTAGQPRQWFRTAPRRSDADTTSVTFATTTDAGGSGKPAEAVSIGGAEQATNRSRRRRTIAVIVTSAILVAASALVAAVWAGRLDDVFAAEAELRYNVEDSSAFNVADRTLEGQTVTIRSRAVLAPAAAALGMDPDDLADELTVALVPDSDVIRVQVTAPTPVEAERRVTAVIDAYIPLAEADDDAEAIAYLDTEIAGIDARIAELDTLLDGPLVDPGAASTARLAAEQEALLERRNVLAERRTELSVEQLTDRRVDVLAPAYASTEPVAPRPMRSAMIAAIAAGLIAMALAYLFLRRPQPS